MSNENPPATKSELTINDDVIVENRGYKRSVGSRPPAKNYFLSQLIEDITIDRDIISFEFADGSIKTITVPINAALLSNIMIPTLMEPEPSKNSLMGTYTVTADISTTSNVTGIIITLMSGIDSNGLAVMGFSIDRMAKTVTFMFTISASDIALIPDAKQIINLNYRILQDDAVNRTTLLQAVTITGTIPPDAAVLSNVQAGTLQDAFPAMGFASSLADTYMITADISEITGVTGIESMNITKSSMQEGLPPVTQAVTATKFMIVEGSPNTVTFTVTISNAAAAALPNGVSPAALSYTLTQARVDNHQLNLLDIEFLDFEQITISNVQGFVYSFGMLDDYVGTQNIVFAVNTLQNLVTGTSFASITAVRGTSEPQVITVGLVMFDTQSVPNLITFHMLFSQDNADALNAFSGNIMFMITLNQEHIVNTPMLLGVAGERVPPSQLMFNRSSLPLPLEISGLQQLINIQYTLVADIINYNAASQITAVKVLIQRNDGTGLFNEAPATITGSTETVFTFTVRFSNSRGDFTGLNFRNGTSFALKYLISQQNSVDSEGEIVSIRFQV